MDRAESCPEVPDEEPFIADPIRYPRVSIIQPQDDIAQEEPVFGRNQSVPGDNDWVMIENEQGGVPQT